MGAVTTMAWVTIAALIVWGLTWAHAAATISRLREQMRQEVRHWQDESERAKVRAAQLAKDIATWTAGCKQGRDDLVTVLPLIIAALERPVGIRAAAEDPNDPGSR
jgi:F0F1-type ATP synthase membrane subunit b/b'